MIDAAAMASDDRQSSLNGGAVLFNRGTQLCQTGNDGIIRYNCGSFVYYIYKVNRLCSGPPSHGWIRIDISRDLRVFLRWLLISHATF